MDAAKAVTPMRISPARDAQLWLSAFEASPMRRVVLFLIGIRDLKQVNDLHGREAGNAVIAEIGRRIGLFAPSLAGAVVAARLPGREFLIIAESDVRLHLPIRAKDENINLAIAAVNQTRLKMRVWTGV